MKQLLVLILLIQSFIAYSQVGPDLYFLQFTDKLNTEFSLTNPSSYLSEKAIQRRNNQGIAIDSLDLPVNINYIEAIKNLGLEIHNTSKWLNGITVRTDNCALIEQAKALPFVKDSSLTDLLPINQEIVEISKATATHFLSSTAKSETVNVDYGLSWEQISLHKGQNLHSQGFKGEDMLIAVIDGGFTNADLMHSLSHLHNSGKIVDTHNFATYNNNVYNYSEHGSMVLSVMASYLPGEYIGCAPEASYMLLISENMDYEEIVEELNLVSALEYADSAGADVANISLGYVDFDNARYNHAEDAMNGHTCPGSIGAEIACSKGMLIIAAAGNSGVYENGHVWLGSPSDAESVICVGAIDIYQNYAPFSSHGRIDENIIKPDFASVGWECYLDYINDSLAVANGTSFASPLTTGLITCFWQKHRNLTAKQIRTILRNAAVPTTPTYENDTTLTTGTPNIFTGRGVLDFDRASLLTQKPEIKTNNNFSIYPNPANSKISVVSKDNRHYRINIFTSKGQLIDYYNNCYNKQEINITQYPCGELIITISIDNQIVETKKIIAE